MQAARIMNRSMLQKFTWKLHLEVEPARLWRYIADTGRLNQAAGLPEWKLDYVPDEDGGSHQVGQLRYMGWRVSWDEHPFEWVEGRQYEVRRDYHNGPLRRFNMAVVLSPENGGTLLEEVLTVEPRWLVLAPVIYWEVGYRSRRRFERVYRRIEQYLQGRIETPFGPVADRPVSERTVNRLRSSLADSPSLQWLPHLQKTLETSSDKDLDRMRAYALADSWGADRAVILKLFLHAAASGLLDLSWDVICPSCRGAKARESRLRDLREEAHCDACNIRYTADFAESVEVTFRPSPAIRKLQVTDYCSGGPMNAPHVVVQQQIRAGESRTIPLQLSPWRYRLRSLKLAGEGSLRVTPGAGHVETVMTLDGSAVRPKEISVGGNLSLVIRNESSRDHTVMLERSSEEQQATSAAVVTSLPEFRSLFSSEALSADRQIRVGTICLMFTDLEASTSMYERVGEASAYARVREHFELLREVVEAEDGTFLKTIGDAVMAVFNEPDRAVVAAFRMHEGIRKDNQVRKPALSLKIGIHQGTCFAVNLNETLDYFGTAVNVAARIQRESHGGDVVITEEVMRDEETQKRLSDLSHDHDEFEVEIRGLSGKRRLHRLTPQL